MKWGGVVVGREKDEQRPGICRRAVFIGGGARALNKRNKVRVLSRVSFTRSPSTNQQCAFGNNRDKSSRLIKSSTFGSGCSQLPPTFIRHHHHRSSTPPHHHQCHPNPFPRLAKPLLRPLPKPPLRPAKVQRLPRKPQRSLQQPLVKEAKRRRERRPGRKHTALTFIRVRVLLVLSYCTRFNLGIWQSLSRSTPTRASRTRRWPFLTALLTISLNASLLRHRVSRLSSWRR